jgi:hypothetical protein
MIQICEYAPGDAPQVERCFVELQTFSAISVMSAV